jgi:phenylpyruvate tautomerase PptA (4-oxalocrotonate tautomerase family)
MPIYTCVAVEETLSDKVKATLAAEITQTHVSVTGAPSSFVNVVFYELPATNMFVDSIPCQHLLINGLIRAGRSDADKTRLAQDLCSGSSRVTGIPEARIVVGIQDIPAKFAVEGGRVLPEPGAEDAWLRSSAS